MTLTAANVRVAVTGVVMVGPTTATPPTGTAGTTTGFTDLGFCGEDGVTESRPRSTNDIKAWQLGATVRTVVTDAKFLVKFTLIESSKAVIELYYGAVTTGATATEGRIGVIPANTGGNKSWIVDVVDGAELKRTYLALGEVTEVGDLIYKNGEPIGYEVTLTGYPASNGESAVIWSTALKT